MPTVTIATFQPTHALGVAAVCQSLGWPFYSDPRVCVRGGAAPGVSTVVALDQPGTVIGFAHVLGDGVVQGYLAQIGVLEPHRRAGIGAALVEAAFDAAGVRRLDALTDDADDFYERFAHRPLHGYRLYSGRQPRDAEEPGREVRAPGGG